MKTDRKHRCLESTNDGPLVETKKVWVSFFIAYCLQSCMPNTKLKALLIIREKSEVGLYVYTIPLNKKEFTAQSVLIT